MSLNFYADANLTLRLTDASPKRFLFPSKGGTKASQVWLGDPYQTTCTAVAHSGDTSITLADTGEFMSTSQIAATSSGHATAKCGSQTFTYTGKTQDQLTGVSGITSTINIGDVVYPDYLYKGISGANVEVFSIGSDILNNGVRVALGTSSVLGFPGLPAIFSVNQIGMGVGSAIQVFLSVKLPAGPDLECTHFAVQVNNLYKRDSADTTVYTGTEGAWAPEGSLYAYRHDEAMQLPIRILPVNRRVNADAPGFIIGKYRWRGDLDRNATALIPTNWNVDPGAVGLEKFIAGIGDQDDLEPQNLVEVTDSIRMIVHRGEYFTGANRYYFPADKQLDFLQNSPAAANPDGTVTLQLQGTPREQAPLFVGSYTLDSQGYYEKGIEYKYMATLVNPNGSPRTDLPPYYYTLDRRTNKITLNKAVPDNIMMYLGVVSGQAIDYFDLPIYPIDNINTLYIDRGASVPKLYATTWTFDREQGTIQLPNIVGSLSGQPVIAMGSPAVAVLYDLGPDDTTEIDTIDFNPAFSGLASGYFYLQHRRQKPQSLVLSCDKPRIAIPATQSSIIGLVAYGPVYFENDYALLKVTAYGNNAGETIPNAKLDVVVDPTTFSGTINYLDPLSQTVSVVTGGDGTANMVFVPKGGFGVWIPTIAASGGLAGLATTTITDDTLVLPAPVPISQIWNVQEGWLVTTYTVLNNDPLYGMVGAIPSLGEIPWATTGTPGTPGYKTNGERRAWKSGSTSFGDIIYPIDALDASGHSYTNSAFDGNVVKLVYATAVPTDADVGAYFVTFIQRVLIKMKLENSNLFSNSILLQMAVPDLINENPWLILNDQIQGRLEQFRLGYVRPTGV